MAGDSEKHWYMQWDVGDWLRDTHVAMCSPATRGIWFDLLNYMHQLDRCGKLTGTREKLAVLGRCTPGELESALADLRTNQVADISEDRHKNVTVINRRMKREADERKSAAERKKRQRQREAGEDVTPVSRSCPETYTKDHNPETINQSAKSKAQNLKPNQPEGGAAPDGSLDGMVGVVGGYGFSISKEDLSNTGKVLEIAEALLGYEVHGDDRQRVVGIAERALRAGKNPGAFFRKILTDPLKVTWGNVNGDEDRRAQKRLQDFDRANKNSVKAMKGVLSEMAKGGSQ